MADPIRAMTVKSQQCSTNHSDAAAAHPSGTNPMQLCDSRRKAGYAVILGQNLSKKESGEAGYNAIQYSRDEC
jgi:hypothetical protein